MNREALKAKIAALRAKTRAAGCTEGEALAAAELAARLLREHQLSEEDLAIGEATAPEKAWSSWRALLASTAGRCTNTAPMFLEAREGGGTWAFVGRDPGPEIALYLRDVCVRAVDTAVEAFKETTPYRRRRLLRTKREMLADFRDGMATRLCGRLLEMFAASIQEPALLEARRAREARYGKGQTTTIPDRQTRFDEARVAGQRAGAAVPLNHGVTGGRAPAKAVTPTPRLPQPPAQGRLPL